MDKETHLESLIDYERAIEILNRHKEEVFRALIDCYFYRAVHAIEAVLAKAATHSTSHERRAPNIVDSRAFLIDDVDEVLKRWENLQRLRRRSTYLGAENGKLVEEVKEHSDTIKQICEGRW